jgi:2-keto-4-pentenoate hydratase/2-oxohepta-3-ene-1,7-dioic acid hydratase in catechol pathway
MKWLRYQADGQVLCGTLEDGRVTMHPGDVIWMGAETPTLDMRNGDVVEAEIGNIGVVRNSVVAESRAP